MVGVAFICCTFVAKIKYHKNLYVNLIYRIHVFLKLIKFNIPDLNLYDHRHFLLTTTIKQ